MAITLEQAKALKPGDILCDHAVYDSDGKHRRWRVNGQPKTWKTQPFRVYVPIKYGLYSHYYIDEMRLDDVTLATECDCGN